ncbi:trypsin-like peptidase domain-containing protein [Streptomyces sp. TRM 70361]|uniref:VMAP-C domain-containing protein n=1 Tax=Streptomyces sp. TRM 70361 TaxID=3116553 RepID=UPI002E7C1C32|nr:trypsin-like peptidase domain-containing protein [Streptomyces sp. TRM 70361]MEE1938815.1 trypsin-like peptidase domain-containing protein [Streptomyces sp. TRM 70361]
MISVEEAVQRSVVRIGAPGGGYDGQGVRFWGSGFVAAPGWVLTCAHVVGRGAGAVRWGESGVGVTMPDGELLTGELVRCLPGPDGSGVPPGPWPAPDLALVRVPDAEKADCLWLSDRTDLAPADVLVCGWTRAPGGGETYLVSRGSALGGGSGPLLMRDAVVVPGCSGAPVVDENRGAVIGICKGAGNGSFAEATPVTALRTLCDEGAEGGRLFHELMRAHDAYHHRRLLSPGFSWPRVHTVQDHRRAPVSGFTGRSRARLYDLFAALPVPGGAGEVQEAADEVLSHVLRGPRSTGTRPPRGWREGAGLLYGDLELETVVLYAAKVYTLLVRRGGADPRVLGELYGWIEDHRVVLWNDVVRDEKVPAVLAGGETSAVRADVLVEIQPDYYGKHPWRVAHILPGGEVLPVHQDDDGVHRSQLGQAIRGVLAAAVAAGDAHEHLAAVEFVLPRDLFDEPVDEWRLCEPDPEDPFDPRSLPIGRRRIVVLRDGRRHAQGVTPEWRTRWKGVSDGPLQAVPLHAELPVPGHDAPCRESPHAGYARLHAAPPAAVPVSCARGGAAPGAAAMAAALSAGHAVALWRRYDADGHTDCAEFHERAAELLGGAGSAGSLPGHVRALRNRNADGGGNDRTAAWARHIVLLYDPPHRPPLPSGPLQAPPSVPPTPTERGARSE